MNRHLDEEEIESYSLQATPEEDVARLEEHLLICPECRERVEASDVFVSSMEAAASEIRRESARPVRWFTLPRMTLALAAGILIASILFPRYTSRENPPYAVSLSAMRGSASGGKAPAGRPLFLQLDLNGIASAEYLRIEIVSESGEKVWQDSYPGHPVRPLTTGIYFVRLYSPGDELLREYGLEIQPSR
ncbi:MAG TPA: hypothetical protein VG456_03270 [Candidatus Sulfopaludibacter sp.]|jgi:hypothetical protein|nr:hypothetical protein [Candidatus Sulfopaludibacter sp.]